LLREMRSDVRLTLAISCVRIYLMAKRIPPSLDVSPCLCDTLRRTTRVVTRIYDEFLRPSICA